MPSRRLNRKCLKSQNIYYFYDQTRKSFFMYLTDNTNYKLQTLSAQQPNPNGLNNSPPHKNNSRYSTLLFNRIHTLYYKRKYLHQQLLLSHQQQLSHSISIQVVFRPFSLFYNPLLKMNSNSPPKHIKFTYITDDRTHQSRTPSSHKRKKIFEHIESPKQYSPFKIIESHLHSSLNDEIYRTIDKINRKLQKMQYLQGENQRLNQQNFQLKNANGSSVQLQIIHRQKTRLEQQLWNRRQKMEKARAILSVLKQQMQMQNRQQFKQLYDLFEL